ncbi:MAG: hypothetical protein A07HB70_01194 [uncultured archaeon A07HB70]|nr:MAG: hypothetical protein A07HB70_01194 [uncultured archaeon A07HB70]
MSDESADGEGRGPRGGDGTRTTVEDLRGGVEPSLPPGELEHANTVDERESALLAAVVSAVAPGAGHVRAGLRQRGFYVFGAWVLYLIVSGAMVIYGIGLVMLVATPAVNLLAGVDGFVQVRRWRGRERPRIG